MRYQDFFENMLPGGLGDDLSASNVDPQELQKGIETEMEHTKEERLAKEIALDHLAEDPHYYSKIASCASTQEVPSFGGSDVDVSVSSNDSGGDMGGGGKEGVSEPGDKSKITAAGKTDTSFAEKTIGGEAAPGEGQEQGGPNTKGSIAGTPNNSEIESTSNSPGSKPSDQNIGVSEKCTPRNPAISGDDKEENMKIEELKRIVKGEIKSVLKEMWASDEADPLDKVLGGHQSSPEELEKAAKQNKNWRKEFEKDPDVGPPDLKEGGPQYKVRDGRSYVEQPGLVNRAREIQTDPEINETLYKERLSRMQSRLSEKCGFCGADDEINEVAPPGKEDWIKANKDRFSKQYGKEKGMKVLYGKAWKDVSENQYKVRDGRSYVEQPGLVNRAREIQTDPNVAEAAYKVQGKSYREFEDSPQFPKACADPKIA